MSKPTDALLGLPPCPITSCSKCGNDDPETGWISLDWGCKKCAPQDEERMLNAASTLERPS